MYIDTHYDQSAHERFAAYQIQMPASMEDWVRQQNDWYGGYKSTDAYQDQIRAYDEDLTFRREGRDSDNAYRNAALSQQGASSRLAASTSRQNAQLAAKTQLKAQKMQIDASYRQFRERLNELEIPTLNLDAWYKQQQVGLAKANLALEARGPRNAFQAAGAMRQLDPSGMPASLAAMARNAPLAAFEGQSGTPEKMSYDALAQQYGFGGGNVIDMKQGPDGQWQQDAERQSKALEAMRLVAARGPQGQAPGTLESMTDYEREIFSSGLEELGYSAEDWMQRYKRAGIGQGNVRAA
jgi:hypothetical protein